MTKFNQVNKEHSEKLELYVPVVARVHGKTHPEFYQVQELYKKIDKKIKEAGSNRPQLDDEFSQLRIITDNYLVPADTCESYQAVYRMLGELDKAYRA